MFCCSIAWLQCLYYCKGIADYVAIMRASEFFLPMTAAAAGAAAPTAGAGAAELTSAVPTPQSQPQSPSSVSQHHYKYHYQQHSTVLAEIIRAAHSQPVHRADRLDELGRLGQIAVGSPAAGPKLGVQSTRDNSGSSRSISISNSRRALQNRPEDIISLLKATVPTNSSDLAPSAAPVFGPQVYRTPAP